MAHIRSVTPHIKSVKAHIGIAALYIKNVMAHIGVAARFRELEFSSVYLLRSAQ